MTSRGETTCSICLSSLSSEPIGIVVPCGHPFHLQCYRTYVASCVEREAAEIGIHQNDVIVDCPNCRQSASNFVDIFIDLKRCGNRDEDLDGDTSSCASSTWDDEDDDSSHDDDDDDEESVVSVREEQEEVDNGDNNGTQDGSDIVDVSSPTHRQQEEVQSHSSPIVREDVIEQIEDVIIIDDGDNESDDDSVHNHSRLASSSASDRSSNNNHVDTSNITEGDDATNSNDNHAAEQNPVHDTTLTSLARSDDNRTENNTRKKKRKKRRTSLNHGIDANNDSHQPTKLQLKRKIKQLKKKLKAHESRNKARKEFEDRIRLEHSKLRDKLETLQQERDEVTNKMRRIQSQLQIAELNSLQNRRLMDNIQTQIKGLEGMIIRLKLNLDAKNVEMERMRKKHKEQLDRAEAASMAEVKDILDEHPRLFRECTELREENRKLNEELRKHTIRQQPKHMGGKNWNNTTTDGKVRKKQSDAVRLMKEYNHSKELEEAERRRKQRLEMTEMKRKEKLTKISTKMSFHASRISQATKRAMGHSMKTRSAFAPSNQSAALSGVSRCSNTRRDLFETERTGKALHTTNDGNLSEDDDDGDGDDDDSPLDHDIESEDLGDFLHSTSNKRRRFEFPDTENISEDMNDTSSSKQTRVTTGMVCIGNSWSTRSVRQASMASRHNAQSSASSRSNSQREKPDIRSYF